jgi:hypothetical protein
MVEADDTNLRIAFCRGKGRRWRVRIIAPETTVSAPFYEVDTNEKELKSCGIMQIKTDRF